MNGLRSEVLSDSKSLSKCSPTSVESTQRDRNVGRAKQAAPDGKYHKAIKTLASGGIASPSETVLQEMQSKHPQSPPSKLPSGPLQPSIGVRALYAQN